MATVPMTQPQNPNQAAGASMSPMSYRPPASAITSTAPGTVGGAQTVPGVTGPAASTAGQPFGGVSTVLPTATTGSTAIGPGSGINWADGSNTVTGDFSDTYGKGTGTAITSVLSGLGTSTDAAVQATNAQILSAAGRQQANVTAQQAAAGISPDSSSAALQTGDFNAQVNQTIASTDAGMQLSDLQTLLGTLTGEGAAHGPDVSGWDTFGNVISQVGGQVGSIVGDVASGGGTLSDFLGGL